MRLAIRTKLLLGFGLVIIMMGIMAWVSYSSFLQIGDRNEEAIAAMEDIVFAVQGEVDHLAWLNQLSDTFLLDREFTGELDHTRCRFGQWYYGMLRSDAFSETPREFQRLFLAIEEPHENLHQTASLVLERLDRAQTNDQRAYEEALRIYEDRTQAYIAELRGLLGELTTVYQTEADNRAEAAAAEQAQAQSVIITATIIALVLAFAAVVLIDRGISRPVNMVVKFLEEIAQHGGDLTQRINVKSRDELGDLAHWFNMFVKKLHDIISSVAVSSESVSSASAEITQGNQDLSQRTEEQASSLEELASTIQQISSGLQLSAKNADEADSIAKQTLEKVNDGDRVVGEMSSAMEDITKGSREIEEIIATVNDIAFQTNLLALNAAVEAARAGEQGKGFAVVAAEVRNLAGRTAESAREIERLIKGSITDVERGNALMDETKAVLQEIIANNTRSGDIVGEISSSISEESTSIEEIRNALDELNDVTQQNASLVEEIASSSEQMNAEAEKLDTTVNQFTLEQQDAQAQAPRPQKKMNTEIAHVKKEAAASSDAADDSFSDFDKF